MSDEPVSITISEIRPSEINEAALKEAVHFDYSIIWIPAVGLLSVALTIWLGFFFYRKWQKKSSSNDPANLFRELCAVHSLSWSHRRALQKLAEIRKTSNPCLVIFDSALWPEDNDPLINRSLQNKLTALHRILFQPLAKKPDEVKSNKA
jgi:hypothetical protein